MPEEIYVRDSVTSELKPLTASTPLPIRMDVRGDVRKNPIVDAVVTTAVGVKHSYTAPAGKTAKVIGASWFNNAGTPTVQLQLVRSGVTIVLRQDAVSYRDTVAVTLEAGDTIQFNVTVAGAAGANADASFSIEEQA